MGGLRRPADVARGPPGELREAHAGTVDVEHAVVQLGALVEQAHCGAGRPTDDVASGGEGHRRADTRSALELDHRDRPGAWRRAVAGRWGDRMTAPLDARRTRHAPGHQVDVVGDSGADGRSLQ